MEDLSTGKLPENAFRELKEGEEYRPVLDPAKPCREVTTWSLVWGLIFAVVFSAACAYLGLKVGQVFEAAIPITIIAVGLAGVTRRRGALGENVIIQSIGACSGMIVAGAIFTLPALYILQAKYPDITVDFFKVFLSSLLGGFLGLLFMIPFRKYFVKEMHGKYPFPEATASTQVLMSGESGSGQARPLLFAGLIGGLYDFVIASFGAWTDTFSTAAFSWGAMLAEKAKLVFKINTGAAVLGMGYIIGLKYSAIICAGSVLVWWVIVPLIPLVFPDLVINAQGITALAASPEQLYGYTKSIGIGAIAMAGLLGIWKSRKIIVDAARLTGKAFRRQTGNDSQELRTQRDLSMKIILIGVVVTLLSIFIFFFLGVMEGNLLFSVVAILLVAFIAFLFTTVAANAIAIVGSNPVSGMTLMTLILASVIMVAVGLKGSAGMVAALLMGSVVCTALSTAGSFVTDLKIGYWLGSSPVKQETYKFLGILVSAATVGGVIMLLNSTYGFTNGQLAAPQANAMAAVIEPLMSGQGAPWLLYAIGAVLAILLDRLGISALAFALGMFIPLDLNLPLLVGGLISWYVTSRSREASLNKSRNDLGTLLASGFIAGGALMGVVSAILRYLGFNPADESWTNCALSHVVSLVAYFALIAYLVKATMAAKQPLKK
ncbi:MAG: oligopeptide transporter, OPT family [Bacteroidaceae bacterium]|nr:oligopeptide transporter, OPT family [Bacteroidaceae bacterium]